MKRIQYLWNIMKLPLFVLGTGMFLMGIGNLLENQNLFPFLNINESLAGVMIIKILQNIGLYSVRFFPLNFLIMFLSYRFEGAAPVLGGVCSYFALMLMTMIFGKNGLGTYAYDSLYGMSVTFSEFTSQTFIKQPYYTGIVSCIIVYIVTRIVYGRSRRRFEYGFFGFISNDFWYVLNDIFWCCLAGIALAYGWPYAVKAIQSVFAYIAENIYGPVNLFIYGVFEQILSALKLDNYIHGEFWLSALGGSWTDNFGKTYTGDINLWTVFFDANYAYIPYGRFITPYYLINIFIVPAFLWGTFSVNTDKIQRRKRILMIILLTVASCLSGSPVLFNIALLLLAPGMFVIHCLIMGFLYALLPLIDVYLGYTYSGILDMATPGSLVNLIEYLGNNNLYIMVIKLVIIGAVAFVIYFFLTRIYFKYLSADFLDLASNNHFNNQVIQDLGGIANIRMINSNYRKLFVHLYDPSKMSKEALLESGAIRFADTRAGYEIEFGSRSSNIRNYIQKELTKYREEINSKPVIKE